MSTVFTWNEADMEALLLSCDNNEVTDLINQYLDKSGPVLESGCGAGRYVKYLSERGWNVTGLEYSQATVEMVRSKWPELDIVQGDVAASGFPDNHFSGMISLGVVEHFPEGLAAPLADMHRILKPGGRAIITVPCMSTLRRFKHLLWWYELRGCIKPIAKRILRGTPLDLTVNRLRRDYRHPVNPALGPFYEYRLTPEAFVTAIQAAGFRIIRHLPIGHVDGMYHELNPFKLLVKFNTHSFEQTALCRALNTALSRWPFFHAHMQAVIVEKATNQPLGQHRGDGLPAPDPV
ncbi:class I SAM-dependent methyltransferase [Ferrovibrio sp.]|uniref:class I SAM-dependent methyltransferase n=1 Tax=Ferrovibrio sp. TaxID=1917215 RepID=UPI003D0B45FC